MRSGHVWPCCRAKLRNSRLNSSGQGNFRSSTPKMSLQTRALFVVQLQKNNWTCDNPETFSERELTWTQAALKRSLNSRFHFGGCLPKTKTRPPKRLAPPAPTGVCLAPRNWFLKGNQPPVQGPKREKKDKRGPRLGEPSKGERQARERKPEFAPTELGTGSELYIGLSQKGPPRKINQLQARGRPSLGSCFRGLDS